MPFSRHMKGAGRGRGATMKVRKEELIWRGGVKDSVEEPIFSFDT